ncbi:MAG: hypothetical protein K0S44_218 [Bacteroidetes bacterium]|jgi:hypothetical protein|nr:hypothetical protein [Bacteroidota bacterium]
MSWIDKLNQDYKITTGDGKVYTVFWRNAQQAIEWNVSEFNFPNVKGTKVDKREVKGRQFPLEFYFQGENHLDEADAFRKSLNSKRPTRIDHPFYGIIIVQIPALNFDNSELNTTKITGTAIETIQDDNPKVSTDPVGQIKLLKEINDEDLSLSLDTTPSTTDVNSMAATNEKNFNLSVPIIEIPEEVSEYTNLFNQASSFINTATASPLLAMQAITTVITKPAQFTVEAQTRIKTLVEQFEKLRLTLVNITAVPSKQIYQIQAGTMISSMCLAAITPLSGDYTNSKSALSVIETLLENYNQFIEDLDSLQSPNGGNTTSFIPNAQAIIGLNNILVQTISNLYLIALNGKNERTLILEKDTNLILLTHRLYSLDEADKNMEELRDNNNLGLKELLQIPKGRKIVYYI